MHFDPKIFLMAWAMACLGFLTPTVRAQTAYEDSVLNQPSGDTANSLLGQLGIHDPSAVIKAGDTYYIYQTGGGFKTSKDRIRWKSAGRVFDSTNTPAWWKTYVHHVDTVPVTPQLWAGDISYWNGIYYFYYSVSAWNNFNSCIGLATNTTLDPADSAYRWVDKGVVIDSLRAANGGKRVNVIDPQLYQNSDGRKYLNFGSFQGGMRQVEINPATGLLKTNPPVPTIISNALGEAANMFYFNGYYYFTASRGGCCNGMSSTYQVVYGRSTTLAGPYRNKNNESMVDSKYTVLLTGDAAHPGKGGQSFFVDHDTLFMAYHVYTYPDGRSLLNIKPVYMDANKWPTLVPSQGTVVTVPPTAIRASPSGTAGGSARAVRLVLSEPGVKGVSGGNLYTLGGKKVPETGRAAPSGVYIQRILKP